MAITVAAAEGCATIHSGPYGVPVDASRRPVPAAAAPLRVSAGEIASASSPYFGLVEVTFENDSPAWVQIDRIDLDFGSPDKNRSVQMPWGDDLQVWGDAVRVRNEVEAENTATVLGAIAIVGAVGAAASRRHGSGPASPGAAIGGALSVASLGALYATERAQAAEAASTGPMFSGTHLLAMPIRVPPGLFTKRWILFYTAARPLGGCIDQVVLGYHLADQRQARVLLHYKAPSEWQRDVCDAMSYAQQDH
ncbi:MAG TPA: hypothetical protein VHO67_22670 [Polyangia bacterium]|nr:hypothetical protein [Polyangia bacterium]